MKANEPKIGETSRWGNKCIAEGCTSNQHHPSKLCSWHNVHGKNQKRNDYYTKSKNGILVDSKTYIDYLKASEYKESYKQFWEEEFLFQLNDRGQRSREMRNGKWDNKC